MLRINFNLITVVSLIIFGVILTFIPYFSKVENIYNKYLSLYEGTCNITHIAYPLVEPYENTSNWDECTCKECSSKYRDCKRTYSYRACIKLYPDIAPNIFIKDNLYRAKDQCSIADNCVCTKYPEYRYEEELNFSKEIYQRYIGQNITCYYDLPVTEVYLNNYFNTASVTGPISILFFLGCMLICSCVILMINIRKRKQERNYRTFCGTYWKICGEEWYYCLSTTWYECYNFCWYSTDRIARIIQRQPRRSAEEWRILLNEQNMNRNRYGSMEDNGTLEYAYPQDNHYEGDNDSASSLSVNSNSRLLEEVVLDTD